MQPVEIHFRNGTAVDGTGQPAQMRDVLIRDGRIAAIANDAHAVSE
jgi:N-acyl-D-aspartate/D-glutamate deacylase